uniref:Protein aurora borealis n=1 Tax=Globodera pallida TaxID=36090 RepID=A0A183BHW0_GLOPA
MVEITEQCRIQESSFVTPGIFRRRKTGRQVRPDGANENKENGETPFQWSIDQLAKIRPVEFDESEELALPPEDWDPSAEFSRSQLTNVEHFWTRNTFIAPSPEVLPTSARGHVHSALCSPDIPSPSSSSFMMSPMMMLTRSQMFESTRLAQSIGTGDKATTSGDLDALADGSDDFEQLERSLSFEVADCIVADMDDAGGFVFMEMRKEGPSVDPIYKGGESSH